MASEYRYATYDAGGMNTDDRVCLAEGRTAQEVADAIGEASLRNTSPPFVHTVLVWDTPGRAPLWLHKLEDPGAVAGRWSKNGR